MRVAVIGNGNWGTTVAKLVAENVARLDEFSDEVVLWVYEEEYEGNKLSEDINLRHANPKYLPGVALPHNIVGRTRFEFDDIDVLLFCLPHQFIGKLKETKLKAGVIAVNLCKGLIEAGDSLQTPSEYISSELGIACSCVMGANIASEVAAGVLSECTVGCASSAHRDVLLALFNGPYFRAEAVAYSKALEISGAVKNVVSLAIGIAEGLGSGKNTQAMVFRRGLLEIKKLCKAMGSELDVCTSACIGDMLVSCICGRNYKCGVEMGKAGISAAEHEKRLNGQKLQGPGTALAVARWLRQNGHSAAEFPITFSVEGICNGEEPAESLLKALSD
ncbi:glycerol-3-phosphate dehydrogenase (NAD+) [Pancytospora philotis]|nr:glycerol-3-phosphate dehydrogenase (NAD+) [Pancytospora philotis]